MTIKTPERIQETRSLYEILPSKSSSSGREFARIVNLLLFHDGRRNGRAISLFDDRAGDYHGLDAFEKKGKTIIIGYQHKFYPSPLNDNYRGDIENSLLKTIKSLKNKDIEIQKWVLVTPQDFVESATRKTGGDVTWFEKLREKHNLSFEIEHWGHTQLQALLLETPSIGLFYYPELFPNGIGRRKTIQGVRAQYDDAIKEENGRIEFVGMPVYKEEAARSVPMENIYIPLSIVPNDADENDPNVQRSTPLELLNPGSRHVVLGDPGSGKTTLLKFLSLFGKSQPLQQRYGKKRPDGYVHTENDERLPVLVTLRRYADALKLNDNLSLVEYIRENIAADFSITDVSSEFFEFYLESGSTIVLFDGLDELPNPSFKKKIRNRIHNLTETYPGNTIVVTSRIYGYNEAVRFDDKKFRHHRLAKLRIEEIEQFIRDWYHARMEKPRDRKEYLDSLISILRNDEHESIRELARNPLLLTIIVLVHRIDAVLPDERHVLYQKCTETLLNTWHTWKFHEMDRLHRAKVDRLNMQRMQAIAYWMHHQMGGTIGGQQSVVSYNALHKFLTAHIGTEKPPNPDYAPEDIATVFIEFIQDRAGLLVEIGDKKFSFVHLTFQEYLTAVHIRMLSELNGVKGAWGNEIEDHCSDPRWLEVIRLLVAGCGSNASQEFLVDQILAFNHYGTANAQLLGGLLLDGVATAEVKKQEVFERLLLASAYTVDGNELKNTLAILRACREKTDRNWETLMESSRSLAIKVKNEEERSVFRLIALSVGMGLDETWNLWDRGVERESDIISLLTGNTHYLKDNKTLQDDIRLLYILSDTILLDSPDGTFLATIYQSITDGFGPEVCYERAFDMLLVALAAKRIWNAPPPYIVSSLLLLSSQISLSRFGINMVHTRESEKIPIFDRGWGRSKTLEQALNKELTELENERHEALNTCLDHARRNVRNRARTMGFSIPDQIEKGLGRDLMLNVTRAMTGATLQNGVNNTWGRLSSDPIISSHIVTCLCQFLKLAPEAQWQETLKIAFLPTVPSRIRLVDPLWWQKTLDNFTNGNATKADTYSAAFQLILDGLLYMTCFFDSDMNLLKKDMNYSDDDISQHKRAASEYQALFAQLADQTRGFNDAPLCIAHCIRDLAYGDESKIDTLLAMVNDDNPTYREIFRRCYWLSTDEEHKHVAKKIPTKRKLTKQVL